MKLTPNTKNNISKNTTIYESGDDITSISLLVTGTVRYTSDNPCADISEITYTAGTFIGNQDIFCGFYSGDFVAVTDCVIVPFLCSDTTEMGEVLLNNLDLLKSLNQTDALANLLSNVYTSYKTLYRSAETFFNSVSGAYRKYESICKKNDLIPAKFDMPHSADNYDLNNLSLTTHPKDLLSKDATTELIEPYINTIFQLLTYYEDLFFYVKILVQAVVSKNDTCLFQIVANLAGNTDTDNSSVLRLIETMKEFTYTLEDEVKLHTGIQLNIDMTKLNFYHSLAKQAIEASVSVEDYIGADSISEEISDNFEKLMTYCSYSFGEINSFTAKLDAYKALKDKYDTSEDTRRLRRDLATEFYKLYECVFFTLMKGGSEEQYVDLFLNFGVLDETLLSEDKLHELTQLNTSSAPASPLKIYLLKDWLTEIYKGKRIPSKNEFDEEYIDYVRKKKKEMNLTAEAEKELLENAEFKVKFELNNLFKCNHRLLGGAPAVFWPMLTTDDANTSFFSSFLTSEKLNDAMEEIVSIDYSVFYRESMYEDRQRNITKEVIMKEIYPEIVLLPCIGVTGTMWQEISGKRINNPGRFVFPTFFIGDLQTILIKTLGRYRWELCKTEQGMAWNDISVPSLTSLFTDYAQFYRKNHDLSPEKKELLKNQLSRCRNSIREVFIMDYFMWVKYESTGAMRLDKIARKILATYCPFEKSIRDKFASHPAFADAYSKYNLDKAKKIKELSNRYSALTRKGVELTDELLVTENFYVNM